jgi:CheY-like chemotaxis protein
MSATILLADDEPAIRNLIEVALAAEGYRVIAALQARRATLKCLCISAYPVDADAHLAVLAKPFSRTDLLQTVRQLLAA